VATQLHSTAPRSLKTRVLCRPGTGGERKMSRGVCLLKAEFGKSDLSLRIGEPIAWASSSESVPFFFARAILPCIARMKASLRCVYDVVRTGTCRWRESYEQNSGGSHRDTPMRRTQAEFRTMCSIFSSTGMVVGIWNRG